MYDITVSDVEPEQEQKSQFPLRPNFRLLAAPAPQHCYCLTRAAVDVSLRIIPHPPPPGGGEMVKARHAHLSERKGSEVQYSTYVFSSHFGISSVNIP
jgi:hypothetical protein